MFTALLVLLLDLTAAAPHVGAPLQATSLGYRGGKPPLAFNGFDVALRNPSAEPRWMILPATFPYAGRSEPAPGSSKVLELQIFRLAGGKVVFVKAVGGEFQAVKLPGRGTIKLRGLNIDSWWEKRPASVELELIVAPTVKIGGQTLETIVRGKALSASGVETGVPGDLSGEPDVTMWHAKDHDEVPVTIEVESRARVTVVLSKGDYRQ